MIPDWGAFTDQLNAAYDAVEADHSGAVATYIPQLARVNPEQFGVSACSIDGQQWGKGEKDVYFCIQSISKAIVYATILEEHGADFVHKHIGREPSGESFNERMLNSDGLPHNPCINAGAIMACALLKPKLPIADRFDFMMEMMSRVCGSSSGKVSFNNATYLSERATADRNFCLAYMMQEEQAFPPGTDLVTTLELYFMMCSIEVTADMLAVAAATFASGGVCPLTGERVFSEQTVRNALSLVASCGMYDASGRFIFEIGFPAKSGVGGGLLIVIPGKCGMATFSPRLDQYGNSVRGVKFCEQLASSFKLHQYTIDAHSFEHPRTQQQLNNDLLVAVKANDIKFVRATVARGANVNYADYDKRTALHVAASEGHAKLVLYLLAHGADASLRDRYDATPLDDAKREKRDDVVALLASPPTFKVRYTAHAAAVVDDSAQATAARYFAAVDDDGSGVVRAQVLANTLRSAGFDSDGSRGLQSLFKQLRDGDRAIDQATFASLLASHGALGRALTNNVALADFGQFEATLTECFEKLRTESSGAVAKYLPTLARADPNKWAAAVCSVSGQQILLGAHDEEWCVSSIAKIVNYLIALELVGEATVHKHVGKEPSGRNSNQLCLDKHNLPHNPAINAGAIMICSLLKPRDSQSDRFAYIKSQWKRLTGGSEVGFDNETFLAEASIATRNWTLAYMMLDAQAFPEHIKTNQDLKETLELFFMCSSLTVTAQQMAIVGATLANGGVNPLTGERVFQQSNVRDALSIMASCGLYDYSGEFQFFVGVPAKSGIGGGIMALQPGVFGICTWSPPLGKQGNSVRGVALLTRLSELYALHVYDPLARNKRNLTLRGGSAKEDRVADLLFAAGSGDLASVRKVLANGVSPNSVDYDNRSPLHVAAAEGHVAVCKILLAAGGDPTLRDRWNATPLDDATRNKHTAVVQLFAP